MNKHVVLDLFAGHGVGVAVRRLGAHEHAVELNDDAVATRAANGMETLYRDVWDVHMATGLAFDTLWGSPPCPTFSAAGKGSGRKQMPLILEAIERSEWAGIERLRAWSDTLEDARSGLTLVPLHYIYRFGPMFVALEQVPAVLPIWEAYATVLRSWGYSVWVGKLTSEMYGVPQTRQRAILMARRDGKEARPPAPTHSRYYSRTPQKLDPDMPRWVSMAEALASVTDRPTDRPTDSFSGLPDESPVADCDGRGSGDRRVGAVRERGPAEHRAFTVVSNYGSGGDPRNRGRRMSTEPSATVTSKFDRNVKEAI